MPGSLSAWAAIGLVAGLTLASRLAGALLMRGVAMSPRLERFLDSLSVSVIAALVASLLAQGGLREAVAVGAALVVALRLRSAMWAMAAGMAVAAGWTIAAG